MTILQLRKSIDRSPLRLGVLLTALAWFAVSPTAQAVNPAPDGGYANGNTAEGADALFSLSAGTDNTAIGNLALHSTTDGVGNTAVGGKALYSNIGSTTPPIVRGSYNTATGYGTLYNNTMGDDNTATGFKALLSNDGGNDNTATGFEALFTNATGSANTAIGSDALVNNNGGFNTAVGSSALSGNTTGNRNTATGVSTMAGAGGVVMTGSDNTATGVQALYSDGSGIQNTATGVTALATNATGSENTAAGYAALIRNTSGSSNTGEGVEALLANTTGNNNTALGFNAGGNLTTGSNNVDIGANVMGATGEANTIRIGKQGAQKATLVAGIFGTAVSGSTVVVNSNGKLGVATSSARYKQNIKPMDKASEALLALKPVTFRYKEDIDPERIPQFGLIAEQVEKVNPDLVVRGEDGKVITVRYEAVNAMLLNEFLKAHRKGQEQETKVAALEATVAQQQKQIEALTETVQKVSHQFALSKPAPQLVANP